MEKKLDVGQGAARSPTDRRASPRANQASAGLWRKLVVVALLGVTGAWGCSPRTGEPREGTPAPVEVSREGSDAPLPEPPAPRAGNPVVVGAPPASGPGVPPRSVPAAAPTRPRIEFHPQFQERGDRPQAKGLAKTLLWPLDLPVYPRTTLSVYEWRPEDGREKAINPRTREPWGAIWKGSLAEMMQPDNLRRHLDTMGPWLDAWVPRDFRGVVCLDVERWNLKSDDFHTPPSERRKARDEHAGKEHWQLLGEFMEQTLERAKRLRPGVTEWGWYGAGGVHPGYLVWKQDRYDDVLEEARRDADLLRRIPTPMPVLYYPVALDASPAERRLSWSRLVENYKVGYGEDRLTHLGYALVNAQHNDGALAGRLLTREQFGECVRAGLDLGMRKFIVWASIGGRSDRDDLQRWIEGVLTPTVREVNGMGPSPGGKGN